MLDTVIFTILVVQKSKQLLLSTCASGSHSIYATESRGRRNGEESEGCSRNVRQAHGNVVASLPGSFLRMKGSLGSRLAMWWLEIDC